MLKPRLLFWLLAVISCFIGNQLISHKFIMIAMIFLLSLPVFSVIYTFFIRKKLHIMITAEQEFIERGENAVWYLALHNASKLQTMMIQILIRENTLHLQQNQIRSSIFVPQNSVETIRLTACPGYSGPFNANSMSIFLHDIFGFFRLKVYTGNELEIPNVYVLPLEEESSQYKEYLINKLESGQIPSGKSMILQDEIDRFREMASGDSLKLIHWKLSARLQEWMVKEFDREDDKSVTVLLNLPEIFFKTLNANSDRLLRLRDYMLDHAYTAIQIFLSRAATVRLKTYQPELVIEEAIHMNEVDLLRKQLAYIPYRKAVDFEQQIHDERFGNEQNILYILTHELNDSIVANLRSIRSEIGGIFLVFVIHDNEQLTQAEAHLNKLKEINISIEVANANEVNEYVK